MKKTGLFNCGILWMFVSLLVSMNGSWAEDALTPTEMSVPTYGTVWEPKAARDSIEAFANDAKDKATVQEKEKSLENKSLGASVSERFSGFFAGEICNESTSITMLTCIADEKLDGNISYPSTGRAGTFSGGTNDALWKAKWDGGGSFLLAPGRMYSVTGTYLNNCYLGTDTVADVDGCSIYRVKTDNKYGLKNFQIFNPTGGTGGNGAWQALSATPVDVFNGSKLAIRVGKTLNIEWPANQPLLKIDAGTGTALATKKDNDEYAVTSTTLSGTDGLHDLSVECCGEKLTGKIRLVSLDTSGYKGEGGPEYYKEDGGGVDHTVLHGASGYNFRVTFKAEAGVSTTTLNPIGLRWVVYRYWDWNTPITKGTGNEITGLSWSVLGNCGVSFYIDENGDGMEGLVIAGREEERGVKSWVVHSMDLKERIFRVKYASTLTSSSVCTTIDSNLNSGSDLLQKRTHVDDYRGLTVLKRGVTSDYTVTPGTVFLDVITTTSEATALMDAIPDADIVYVDRFTPDSGMDGLGRGAKVLLSTGSQFDTFPHEIGHALGLKDYGCPGCPAAHPTTTACTVITDPVECASAFTRKRLMYHSNYPSIPRNLRYTAPCVYLKQFEAAIFQHN